LRQSFNNASRLGDVNVAGSLQKINDPDLTATETLQSVTVLPVSHTLMYRQISKRALSLVCAVLAFHGSDPRRTPTGKPYNERGA